MSILELNTVTGLTSVGLFLGQAEESSFWGEMAWTLLAPIVIFLFAVWCKRKMEKLD